MYRVNTSTIELAVTQVLFTDKNRPIDREFEDLLTRIYEADHNEVNFHNQNETYYKVNKYVSDKTNGRLGNIINYDDLKDAQMLLISGIYFKGQWKVNANKKTICC